MQIAIIDFHYLPARGQAYAALAKTMQFEVLVVGQVVPQTDEFAWVHLAHPAWLAPLAVRRNLQLARARHWIAVEPSPFDMLVLERSAKQLGVTWEAWLDSAQGAAWSAYLVRRAVGQDWEAVPWRTGLHRLEKEAA